MNLTDTKLVVDTYAWIEYFNGTEEGERAKKIIEGQERQLFTPSAVIAELSDIYRRKSLKDIWEARRKFITVVSSILDLDSQIADAAGAIKQELRSTDQGRKAGLVDAILLAHGKALGAKILTGDKHLIGRKEVVSIKNE